MTTQSEQALENNLIKQLVAMKCYERVVVRNEQELQNNLKAQLEKHNSTKFSDKEFVRILIHLNRGNVFDRAKILRDKMSLVRDDGKTFFVQFLNTKEWCQNEFQVANQVMVEGNYKNRYDVTILINGLPLVQIELKRRGLELKEAFNQVNRYHRHSYHSGVGLFQYIQMFVVSNGVNTKYYANNRKQSYKQTFFWADVENKNITKLDDFAKVFLEPCHLAKMICKYTVLAETDQVLMVLRPYQYYAVEKIIERVENSNKNGYIWHTTGSGKTLTSFKASQILVDLPEIHKVVFVVDRNDLDYQTIKEFNSFKEGSVDGTDDTRMLVKQFGGESKLIVTTIQKLNNAISSARHLSSMQKQQDKKIVFIFDECHRSQFGATHKKITEFFTNKQMFGFTGTPILAENASGSGANKRTTKDLFGDCLHKYVITDAIKDDNVLKFSVEYVGKYKQKHTSKNDTDIDVEGIDIKELMESPKRLEKIVDYIIANHSRKTHSKEFNAIFCVSSVDVLTKYYEIFKAKKEADELNLKVATIFSYTANEEDKDANGILDSEIHIEGGGQINKHSRDKLESYISDYNAMFGTNFTTRDSKSFYNYYRDIAKKVKKREIDILLVVNMFLTGFDSKTLNTLYVDKNLKFHGLIQAYSRTNRILNDQKSQGNIVVFRNLKKYTDEAVALYSSKDAKEIIFIKPYEQYVAEFNAMLKEMQKIANDPQDVDKLISEEQQLQFVTSFRELLRVKNVLESFVDFTFEDLGIEEQTFEDFKSKYLDIYDRTRNDVEKVSILDDVDFDLELISRDEINVDYILRLIAKMVDSSEEEKLNIQNTINNILAGDPELRSKRELIEKFIKSTLPQIEDSEKVENEFDNFWEKEKLQAFEQMCRDENIEPQQMQRLVDEYLFTGLKPRRDELVATLKEQPRILERDTVFKRVSKKLTEFIDTFVEKV